jgi:putative selenate reductase
MSDRFRPLTLDHLTSWIADELEVKDSVFGIPRALAFSPDAADPFRSEVYRQTLETPLGVAAGPHSQLAQNIIVAWLCGARFIELKTVQTLDNLSIPKPCIDMQDEGYNVEWSQELSIEESFREYLHAWVLIHALHRRFGFPGDAPGVIFNLSVGYDLEGIRQPNMQHFLDRVEDAGDDLAACLEKVTRRFPELSRVEVPSRMSDNVTLSTMHGCPPDEIGAISEYLLRERRLHTSVKLNPTLLGARRVRGILNGELGFSDVTVPDEAFAHDLVFADAVSLIETLRTVAGRVDLQFGVKLTNTLEVRNHRRVFDPKEQNMYLSGRPLHALTVSLADRLTGALGEPLLMSFSGGADAANTPALLRCGLRTVTVCSDLLKPGGYLRLGQYLDNLRGAMATAGAASLQEFILSGAPSCSTADAAAAHNLSRYADEIASESAYHAETFHRDHTKTRRLLGLFDCIHAPCTDICDIDQKVPEYMRRVRDGDLDGAAAVTREDNPLASILGRTCHNPCEPVCLRTHMDQPLAIREIKRFITDHENTGAEVRKDRLLGPPVAVVGGGPCGLAAATFLARAGRAVTVFEARPSSGGMVSATIPDYRAPHGAVDRDLERVRRLGVEFRFGQDVGPALSLDALREEGFATIVIAVGARRGRPLGLDGEGADGVFDGLDFLLAARTGDAPRVGPRVGIVGGGDVAMDCARTARRLTDGEVTVFYRRTRKEMPAQNEELRDLIDEGGRLIELAAPQRLKVAEGRLRGVVMETMELGEADASGRRRPQVVNGAEYEVELDTLIVAIGQLPDLGVFAGQTVALTPSGYLEVDPETFETSLPEVYAGGDIIGTGPVSIVKAAGDGRKIAEAILAKGSGRGVTPPRTPGPWPAFDRTELLRRRARVEPRVAVPHLSPAARTGFDEVVQTLTPESAAREAARCVDCDVMCSTCDGVCPNRAIITYTAKPALLKLPALAADQVPPTSPAAIAFRVAQGPQVAVLADACNECGNCVTFCPTSGRPWLDKPRLYLHRGDFESQDDNAFMLLRHQGLRGIQARFGGKLHELFEGSRLRYALPHLVVELHPDTLEVQASQPFSPDAPSGGFDPAHLGAMITLLRSLTESMPELPVVDAEPAWLIDSTFGGSQAGATAESTKQRRSSS